MATRLSRRFFLQQALAFSAAAASIGIVEGAKLGSELLEQHETWVEASRPNTEFFRRHAARLARLTIGGSFAPEQWRLNREGQAEAMQGLDFAAGQLGMRELRLGLRWRRSVNGEGRADLTSYRPLLDYCFSHNVNVCLNPGPIKVFRWPEEHVPRSVLQRLENVPAERATIRPQDPLASAAIAHLGDLLMALEREYGQDLAKVRLVQVENEPFYPLGRFEWRMSRPYLETVAEHVDQVFPKAGVLLTSAGRLNLDDVKNVFRRLLAQEKRYQGRLVSGFDFHYKTPLRDSVPVIRHFDQISYSQPFATSLASHIRDSRKLGYRIEVTEAQAEPYGHFRSPGNSAREFRFLLLRLLDKALDQREPALIRIWGVEELTKRFLHGDATDEHHQIVEIIQRVNGTGLRPDPAGRES